MEILEKEPKQEVKVNKDYDANQTEKESQEEIGFYGVEMVEIGLTEVEIKTGDCQNSRPTMIINHCPVCFKVYSKLEPGHIQSCKLRTGKLADNSIYIEKRGLKKTFLEDMGKSIIEEARKEELEMFERFSEETENFEKEVNDVKPNEFHDEIDDSENKFDFNKDKEKVESDPIKHKEVENKFTFDVSDFEETKDHTYILVEQKNQIQFQTCVMCNLSISKDEIAQHFKKCVLDKYLEDIENEFIKSIEYFNVQCPECDLICPKKSLLDLHIRITHEYEVNKFGKDITQEKWKCEFCSREYLTKNIWGHIENCEMISQWISKGCHLCGKLIFRNIKVKKAVRADWKSLSRNVYKKHLKMQHKKEIQNEIQHALAQGKYQYVNKDVIFKGQEGIKVEKDLVKKTPANDFKNKTAKLNLLKYVSTKRFSLCRSFLTCRFIQE